MAEEFYAFIIWILVVVVVFFLARNYNITWWSSLVLALFIGLLVLVSAVWLRDFRGEDCDDSDDSRDRKCGEWNDLGRWVLCFFALISIIIVIIYVIQRVFEDQCEVTECATEKVECKPDCDVKAR